MLIGVIAEDISDIDVLSEITCKLVDKHIFSFKYLLGKGCGKLRRKCTAWAENLLERGCTHLIVIHDLDDNDEIDLRQNITKLIKNVRFRGHIILIPIREIESWLLTGPEAIRRVFNMKKPPNLPKQPEKIMKPKEKLRDIVWKYSKKRYFNTIHNRQIAEYVTIDQLIICTSFKPYPVFINKIWFFRKKVE